MKKTKFYALLFFLTVAMSGCDNEYDDTGIRTQIAEVTDQVKALQTLTEALQNRDYILSVVPWKEYPVTSSLLPRQSR